MGFNFTSEEVKGKKMTKQAILENVLDMFLTSQQIDYIKDEWKAFYTDPLKYKDSVVVDMVKMAVNH